MRVRLAPRLLGRKRPDETVPRPRRGSSWRRSRAARLAAVTCAGALVTAACGTGGGGGESGGKKTVTFMNWAVTEDATRPGIKKMIAYFEKQNPNINIESIGVSYSNIATQILRQAQAGNPPCMAEVQGNYTLSLAEAGLLQPLGELASPEFENRIIERELELGVIGGKLQAIPWTVAPFGLWYNKKIMQQVGLDPQNPPKNFDELLAALKKVHQAKPDIIAFGMDTSNRTFGLDTSWSLMKAFGDVPFKNGKASANTPGMKRYLSFMRTIAKQNYTPPGKKGGYFREPAANGQVAFVINGPYLKNVVQSTTGMSNQEFFDTWGLTTLPAGPAGGPYSVPTDHQLAMLEACENPQAAWKFMRFLAVSKYAIVNYTLEYENSIPPIANPSPQVAKQLDNPIAQTFIDDIVPTVTRPEWGQAYSSAYSEVMASVQQAMTSSDSIDEIARRMQAQLEAALR